MNGYFWQSVVYWDNAEEHVGNNREKVRKDNKFFSSYYELSNLYCESWKTVE